MPFAPYADGMIADAAKRDALAILESAAQRCAGEEVRGTELDAALAYLRSQTGRAWFFDQFENVLAMTSPDGRWQNANAALNGICRQFGIKRCQ